MPLILRYAARSDVGLVRDGNEDSGYAGPRLLAVADGMGGHAAGEVASAATVEELSRVESDRSGAEPQESLVVAIRGANDRIRRLVEADPRREGMGTTVTALLWTGEGLVIGHIGDSRAYLLRDGDLRRITRDHTFVQSLVDEGRISEDEAGTHPARSLLLRALDGRSEPEPDVEELAVQAGDRLLVCSDGLSGVVSDATIRDVLVTRSHLVEAAAALVDLALKAGAPDNVTCVVADVVESDTEPEPDDTAEAFLVGAAAGDAVDETARRQTEDDHKLSAAERAERVAGEDDPETLRYAPRPPRRFVWLRRVVLVALLGALVYAGVSLALDWVGGQYYVGADSGDVAVFRGVSQQMGPVQLSELYETSAGLPVEALPQVYRNQVAETIPADDLDDAERIVSRLRREACAAHPPQIPEPTPAPTATPTPAAGPGVTPAATPTRAAATPAATLAATPASTTPAPTTPSPALPTPTTTATPGFPGLDCEEVTEP